MARIRLDIYRGPHPPASQIGYSLNAIQITAQVALRTASGWTPLQHGIVDTGAPVSLLPLELWRDAERQIIGDVRVGGLVALDQCRIPAKLARVSCVLSDSVAVVGPLHIHAYLAESDKVPLLLGVADLIESGTLLVTLGKRQATFEL